MVRVLVIGVSPYLATAYSFITDYVSEFLGTKHEVIVHGEGYSGITHLKSNYILLSSQTDANSLPYVARSRKIIDSYNRYSPDIVLTIGDLFVLDNVFKSNIIKVPIISYFPIDGSPCRTEEVDILKKIDYPIVPAKYGLEVIKKEGVKGTYIPHIVNPIFKPKRKEYARKQFGIDKNLFIFGYNSTNCHRKGIHRILEAFAKEFKGNSPMVKLWLNCLTRDYAGWDLIPIIKGLGIEDKVIFTPWLDTFSLTSLEMNMLYNSWDVNLLPTTGEGFGLSTIESGACGICSIVTDYSASPEVMGKGGLTVRPITLDLDRFGCHKAIIDEEDLGRKMRLLYEDSKLRRGLGREALRNSKRYNVEDNKRMWLDLIDRVCKEKKIVGKNKLFYPILSIKYECGKCKKSVNLEFPTDFAMEKSGVYASVCPSCKKKIGLKDIQLGKYGVKVR